MGGPGSGKSKKPITRERPRTRWFCRWVPQRSQPRRVFIKEAARFNCVAIKRGATWQAIEEETNRRCLVRERVPVGGGQGLLGEAYAQLNACNNSLDELTRILVLVNIALLTGVGVLSALPAPPLRVLGRVLLGAQRRIGPVIIEGQAVRVANDALMREILITRQIASRVLPPGSTLP